MTGGMLVVNTDEAGRKYSRGKEGLLKYLLSLLETKQASPVSSLQV